MEENYDLKNNHLKKKKTEIRTKIKNLAKSNEMSDGKEKYYIQNTSLTLKIISKKILEE